MRMQHHWDALAKRLGAMGPPQVPGRGIAAQIESLCGGAAGLTVLLGVTPAIAALGERLLAFDGSPGMIAAIWPGDDARRRATVADWTALPLHTGVARQVIGDGSLNVVPNRDVLRSVLCEVRRVLNPEGRAVFRVFARPEPVETLGEVLAAATDGRIETLNVLRWRLAAALAHGPEHVVRVSEILQAAEELGDLAAFAQAKAMNADQAVHFHAYRGSPAAYVFPDRTAMAQDAGAARLTCTWVETSGYPGARDCPLAVLRPV